MVWLWVLLGIIVLAVLFWWLFHRDPNRVVAVTNGFLSPADGKVAAIYDIAAERQRIPKGRHGITALFDDVPDARFAVVIMMRLWDVHVQRAPVTGRIKGLRHRHGTFRNAVLGDWEGATVENENVSFTFSGERPCKVYLVAGLVARRIEPLVKRGQHVVQGQRIGRIRLGSQVVLIIPDGELQVSVGGRVTAGRTEIAR